jgi:hypothetical protein
MPSPAPPSPAPRGPGDVGLGFAPVLAPMGGHQDDAAVFGHLAGLFRDVHHDVDAGVAGHNNAVVRLALAAEVVGRPRRGRVVLRGKQAEGAAVELFRERIVHRVRA